MRKILFFIGLMFSIGVFAQDTSEPKAEKYQAGVHYIELGNPIRTRMANKITVAEFFWYGCGGCYRFEPVFVEWQKTAAEDVFVEKIPGTWKKLHAQMFYTADFLGILKKSHQATFEHMHNDPNRRAHQMLMKESEIREFFSKFGVSKEDFEKEFKGGSVKSQMVQTNALISNVSTQLAKSGTNITTPSFLINGKYFVSLNDSIPNYKSMMSVVDFLIAKERG